MMKYSDIIEATDRVERLATDPRFNNSVDIVHEDGSHLHFNFAFALSADPWFVVFTEHNGRHLFNKGDVVDISMNGPRLTIDKAGAVGWGTPNQAVKT